MDTSLDTSSRHRPVGQGHIIPTFAGLVGATLLLMACASTPPPTALMAVSASAVTDAAAAGGNDAAPVEMRAARDKLDRAKLAMGEKKYDVARALAEEAQVDAHLAEAKAHATKAGKAADTVREDSRILKEELDRKTK
jgi:Domain of unknown function (DUF4398)